MPDSTSRTIAFGRNGMDGESHILQIPNTPNSQLDINMKSVFSYSQFVAQWRNCNI